MSIGASHNDRWASKGNSTTLASSYATLTDSRLRMCIVRMSQQAGEMNVLSKTKIALSAAVVLSATFPTWAATKHHHRVTYARPQMYDAVPDHNSGDCSPVHPPFCSNICTGSGPCAP